MPRSRTKPGGGPRTLVVLVGALAALGLCAAPASAQLPDEPVGGLLEPAHGLVRAPLPAPLEEVVQDSPVAPVREVARDAVGDPGERRLPGGGSEPAAPPARIPTEAGASAPSTDRPTGEAGDGPDPGRAGAPARGDGGRDREDGAADARGGAADARDGAADARDGAPAAAERSAEARARSPVRDDEGALARTVERIVEVVPRMVWVALGALALLALAFGLRSLIDRRRAQALQRERERLLHDMSLLERVLLPQVPERLGDLAASVAYRPAAGPAAGGDFYDVFELPGGRVALVVGDVSGHGREALERTSSLRPALRGHLEAGLSPREALASAGRAAGVDASGGFTTAIAAVHDPSSATLTYAAAGHPPPVLVGPGAHEPLTMASAPPIGVGLRTGLRQTTVALPRGSAACFVTDGILEARSGEELLGREWLAGVVAEFGPLDSAAALLERVVERADTTPDDMTVCLIRAVAGPAVAGPRVEELRLEPDDVGAAAPEQLLAACGVPADAVEAALAEARRLAVKTGEALLTVTIDGGHASVRVTAPTREHLATT